MKINLFILLVSFCAIGCNNSSVKAPSIEGNSVEASMNNNADILLADTTINAISIGIYKDGKTYINHYGELDKGKGNKPTDETVYEIGSVSKTFAGTLVAQAELDGKLNLEDDIRKYLKEDFPNFEYGGEPIRVKHLITHTSRLPRFLPDKINQILNNPTDSLAYKIDEAEKNYSKEKFFTDLHAIVLDTTPGVKDSYSSVDTELMAHILENVYNTTYNELIQEKICARLSMTSTGTILAESLKSNLANGYLTNNRLAPPMTSNLWGAGGGITSTLPDLMKYAEFQLDKENDVSVKSHQVVFQNGDFKIGYYWPVNHDELCGGTYYSHQGGAFGIQNYLFIIPEKNMGLSVVTNQNYGTETANKLMKVVEGILVNLK